MRICAGGSKSSDWGYRQLCVGTRERARKPETLAFAGTQAKVFSGLQFEFELSQKSGQGQKPAEELIYVAHVSGRGRPRVELAFAM